MTSLPEVVQDFSHALQTDLKTADSMQIYVLTEIAQDNIEYSKDIAKVICTRINTAPSGEKLFSLYLLDSIAKKIRGPYIQEFSRNISDVFFYAYKQNKDNSNIKKSYLKLLSTWNEVFGDEKVNEIKNRIDNLEGGGSRVQQQTQSSHQQSSSSGNSSSGMKRVGSSDQSEQALLGTLLEKLQRNPDLINDPQTSSLFQQLTSKMRIDMPQIPRPNPYAPPVNQSNTSQYNSNSGSSKNKSTPPTNPYSSGIQMMQNSVSQQSNKPSSTSRGVHQLYGVLTKQCMNCGVRFSSQKQLGEHLDSHQKKNQFFRNNKDLSRKWYSGEDEWMKLKDNDETEAIQCPGAIIFGEAESSSTVPMKPVTAALSAVDFFATFNTNSSKQSKDVVESGEIVANTEQDTCPVCHEELDKFYSSEHAEWMLKGAVFDESLGLYVHQSCLSSVNKRKSEGGDGNLNKKLKQEY